MLIRIIDKNRTTELEAPSGATLLDVLRSQGHTVPAPCGGKGTCGKCLVEIDTIGPVLACQTRLDDALLARLGGDGSDITVRLPDERDAMILVDGILPHQKINPLVCRARVQVEPPALHDPRADDRRFEDASGYAVPFHLLPDLPAVLEKEGGGVTFVGRNDTRSVIRFEPAYTSDASTGKSMLPCVAIDIGTTTLAAFLVDLETGSRLASSAMINPQVSYGGDVISRIAAASENPATRDALRSSILKAITRLLVQLVNQVNGSGDEDGDVAIGDIVHITLAGNTTMMHLLTGLPAANIARSPFNPVTTRGRTITGAQLGLEDLPDTLCTLLPSVASYVGADITAGIVALGLEQPGHESTLLIDIGTNGEIALRTGDRLTACATAAGPAFEGANISCGMSGIAGAIDHVWMNGDDLCYSVITAKSAPVSRCGTAASNGDKPCGLCGSGLIDAVAVMLETGVIDETGLIGADPDALSEPMRARLTQVNGQPAFILATAEESQPGSRVHLTQKDIREVQNAKAAIAAGIALLLEREGLKPGTIGTVYLAGGFGQYLNVRSARLIGLLPAGITGSVVSAGNTSAMGALRVLLDAAAIETCQQTADRIVYRELSADPLFSDLFIEALMFEEP